MTNKTTVLAPADDSALANVKTTSSNIVPIRNGQGDGRQQIVWEPQRLNEMIDAVVNAMARHPGRWALYRYGGIVVRLALRSPPQLQRYDDTEQPAPSIPALVPCTKPDLRLRIDQSVAFYKLMKQGRLEPIGVPSELPALLLNAPNLNLPITTGLVTHPLILPSGQVLDAEGLDADSGLVLHFGGAFRESLAVDTISPEEGLARLREEMLGEFEFASAADEAAALALVLTAVERRVMDTAPGFMINASMQGSGKTTLARMVHLLVTGHDLPVAGMSESLDEQDKALTAMLLTSAPIVCFDNLPDGALVASRVLARVLTSSTHTGRVLGLSKSAG